MSTDIISLVWGRADRAQTRADEAIIGLLRQAESDRDARARHVYRPAAEDPLAARDPQPLSQDTCTGPPSVVQDAKVLRQSAGVRCIWLNDVYLLIRSGTSM